MMQNRETSPINENTPEPDAGDPWADMAETAPPFNPEQNYDTHEKAKVDSRGARDYIVNRFLNSLEFSGVVYDEAEEKVVSEDDRMAEYMKDQVKIYGVDAMLEVNENLSRGMKLTTQEHNNELADRVYVALSDKYRTAKLNAEDGEAKKHDTISNMLVEIENSVKMDEESGDVQTLDSAARHLILKENRQYLRAVKSNRLTEKDKQQYNLRIALIEEVRGYLRGGEELLASERLNQNTQEQEGKSDDEFEITKELEPTGKTSEQIAQEEQERKREEDEARAERMRKYEEDRQRKKQQELDELRRRVVMQTRQKDEEQRRRVVEEQRQRELLMEDEQENEDEMEM